jgi:hypothetical protein
MSSFDDIYHRLLCETHGQTIHDRLDLICSTSSDKVKSLLYPFLQVISEPEFTEWYNFMLHDDRDPATQKQWVAKILSTKNKQIRRIIDLILAKC